MIGKWASARGRLSGREKDRPLVNALESMELSPRTDPYVFMVD